MVNPSIKLVVYDFDGVLTDNHVWVTQEGLESVSCNRSDGWWIGQLRKLGVDQMILSTEVNPVVSMRARKLKLEVVQGQEDKKKALLEIAQAKKLSLSEICYIGNDMNDIDCLRAVGLPMCPQDSHPEVIKASKKVFPVDGGQGVARHLYDYLTAKPQAAASASGKTGVANFLEKIETTISESIRVKQALLQDKEIKAQIEQMGTACSDALQNGKKIIFAGNGGSFADAMHLAAEFVSKLLIDRSPLASIALGTANSNLTAIGNDYGYDKTFEREILALGQPGDIFFAISTSGNSPNVLAAVKAAKSKGITVFGWSGQTGGKLAGECVTLRVPSKDTARIQECHIMVGHLICEIAETPFLEQAAQ